MSKRYWRWIGLAALAIVAIILLRAIGVGYLELAVIVACLLAGGQALTAKR